MTEFLLAPVVFAILATLASRRFGHGGLIAVALVWMAAVSAWILASVPGPEVPLHSFERTPVPTLLATLAGTAAATAYAIHRGQPTSVPVRILLMTGVYLMLAAPILIGMTLRAMG